MYVSDFDVIYLLCSQKLVLVIQTLYSAKPMFKAKALKNIYIYNISYNRAQNRNMTSIYGG